MQNKEVDYATRKPKKASYWLLVRELDTGTEILSVGLSEGQKALPVFSFKEEAEMFLCLSSSRDDWQVREILAGKLLSMFRTVLKEFEYVTLDPIPEYPCLNFSGMLSIARKDFIVHLMGAVEKTLVRRPTPCEAN